MLSYALLWAPFLGYESHASSAAGQKAGKAVDFVQDIQPMLKGSCYQCHGPDVQMGQLRLDSKTLALRGGISGKAIISGDGQGSLLVHRVLGLDSKVRMPLQGDPLTQDQVALVQAWIDQGAQWPDEASVADAKIAKHWAYIKPVRPAVPVPSPLKGRDKRGWVRNPIDSFVLARLEQEGLLPSPEASRETLIRRLSLDLIGLPPSIEDIEAFLSDAAPDAYEKLVDRLLASPHYGERWARPWLDLARYADTNGYESDQRRSIWKYRDWVINALNKDMPFDQFTIEQIAGDMLPSATLDQRIATGFHRNTMRNEENGVDQEEARWTTLVERVGTTASVWLGTTLACAQCHNHKYDPFSQKEFYQLLAFFENTDYRIDGPRSYQKLIEPVLELPTPEQDVQRTGLREEIAALEEALRTQTPELDQAQAQWERQDAARQLVWRVLDVVEFRSSGGATFTKSDNQSILVGTAYDKDTYTVLVHTKLRGITAFQLELLPDSSLPGRGPGYAKDGNCVLTSFKVQSSSLGSERAAKLVELQNARADFSQDGFSVSNVLDRDLQTGWGISPQAGQAHHAIFEIQSPIGDENGTTLIFTLDHQSSVPASRIGKFRLSASTVKQPMPALPLPENIRPILITRTEERSEEQRKELSAYFRSITPLLNTTRERLFQLRDELAKLPILTTLVMEERPSWERPSTYLRVRGNYTARGEKVYANVPAELLPLPESQLATRLGLAHWLVDENNPLVARVTVNRAWEQFFGRGIVETSEDFGTRGERPTHPELLDWLATQFMQQGWSLKTLHRLIVTSATYRQSSQVTPALLERDPANKLLARGPRFRLEAEMIRDMTLAASGLLSRKIGGPSVFPFQPESVWSTLISGDKWLSSEGEDRYRRGLYTFWRRTAPYPSFVTFDATSRESCTVRRTRTNTPLQALTALNDPASFESARSLASRIRSQAGPDSLGRAIYGFRLCVSRQPQQQELDQLLGLFEERLEYFRQQPSEAQELTQGGAVSPQGCDAPELAAWTIVSNLLLNLDETLTKE